jgi:hypothetical protein
MNLTGKSPKLYAISGKAPDRWIDPIWELSASPPFRRPKRVSRPLWWCSLHIFGSKITVIEEDVDDSEGVAEKICNWCLACIKEKETQEVIRIIADRMPALEEAFAKESQ